MEDNYERYAIAVIIVFGAVITLGLMAAGIATANRPVFFLALGSASAGWIAGHAMLFDRPRVYGVLILLAAVLAVASAIKFGA
ncbi:MAG: hypothetical protein AB7S80_09750 [Rhizobiaceae bacterium]